MSVNEVTARNQYTASGSNDTFAYLFKILTADDIQVFADDAEQNLDTDYSVTGLAADGGGSVVFATDPVAGTIITLIRKQPLSQLSDYVPNETFPARRIETDYDKHTMVEQMLAEIIARTLKLPARSPVTLPDLPLLSSGLGKFVGVNEAGTGFIYATPGSVAGDTYNPPFTGAVERTVTSRLGDIVSLQDFDVDPSGVEDSTAGWRAFLAAAGGKIGLIPAGTYLIDLGTVHGATLPSNTHLIGAPGSIVKWTTKNTSNTAAIRCLNVSNIEIEGLKFLSTNTSAGFTAGQEWNFPILINASSKVKVHHCTFQDIWANSMIQITDDASVSSTYSDDCFIHHNHFVRGGGYGAVVVSGRRNKIHHNYAEDCSIGQESNNTTNIVAYNEYNWNTVKGVLRLGNGSNPLTLTLGGRDSDDVENQAVGNELDGARFVVNTGINPLIAYNNCYNWNGATAAEPPMFIGAGTGITGGRVIGNRVDATSFTAARTDGRGALAVIGSSTDVLVAFNDVRNAVSAHGIAFRDTTRIKVIGNTVKDNGGSGIHGYLTNADPFIMLNTVVDNNGANTAAHGGIVIEGDSGGNVTLRARIEDNTVISPGTNKQRVPIRVSYTTNARIIGNQVTPRNSGSAAIEQSNDTTTLIADNWDDHRSGMLTGGTLTAQAQGVLKIDSGSVATIADTNETTLKTYTLKGNTLFPAASFEGAMLRITAAGIFAGNANTKTINVKVGSTVLITNDVTTAPNGVEWEAEVVLATNSSSNVYSTGKLLVGAVDQTINNQLVTATMTGDLVLTVTGLNGTASAGDITCNTFLVELQHRP